MTKPSLSRLLLTDVFQAHRWMCDYYIQRCPECRPAGRRSWEQLCEQHAPVVRSIIEPNYMRWLEGQIIARKSALETVQTALEALDTIDKGKGWIETEKPVGDRLKKAQARLRELNKQIPPQFAGWSREAIEHQRQEIESKLAYFRERQRRISDGAEHLRTAFAGTGATRVQRAASQSATIIPFPQEKAKDQTPA